MATIKQKKALKNLVENGGNVSKAMRDAGYSPETASDPKKLTTSKGFQELIAQTPGLKDEEVLEELSGAIHSKKVVTVYGKDGNKTKEISETSSNQTRGMDMFFKLRGHYAPEKKEISGALSLSELFDE